MQKIRYYIAILMGKFTSLGLKILNKRVPYYPGYIALRICPNFLKYVHKPKITIAITGTNGKSTISALLIDVFKNLNYRVIHNNGFNVKDGIAAMFLKDISLFHKRAEVVVLEVDEKSSGMIFKEVKPDYLICTNLFRDSMKSNSNFEYIASKINEGIPKDTKVIMPADDLITSSYITPKKAVYYGINCFDSSSNQVYNLVCDLVYCPKCGHKLDFEYVHYHHIGKVNCSKCGFENPKRKYEASIDLEKKLMIVNKEEYKISNSSIFNLYNQLSVISLLKELKISNSDITRVINEIKITDSRYSKEEVNGITIVNQMAKGQNPVATSSAFNYVRSCPGNKAIVLILDDVEDKKYSVETISWYYDTDFEFLNDDNIKKILIGGVRAYDVYVRLLYAGVPKDKLEMSYDQFELYKKLDIKEIDSIYILHDIHEYDQSLIIKKQIKEVIQK